MGTKSCCSLLAYINILKELLLSCLRDKAKIAPFSKLSNFYFGLRHPRANPQARQRSENPTPGATRMCESPGVARAVGQAWNCLSKGNKRSSTPQSFICNQLSTYSLKLKSYDRTQIILCISTKWLGPQSIITTKRFTGRFSLSVVHCLLSVGLYLLLTRY